MTNTRQLLWKSYNMQNPDDGAVENYDHRENQIALTMINFWWLWLMSDDNHDW